MRTVLKKTLLSKHRTPWSAPELSATARHRLTVLDWYAAHGRHVAQTARHFGHSRTTVTAWLARYDRQHLETLEDRSRRPHHTPRRRLDPALVTRVRDLRRHFPEFGKHKLWCLLDQTVSESTVGRVIRGMPGAPKRYAPGKKPVGRKHLRKPADYVIQRPGDLVAFDTIVCQRDGVRKYVIVALDLWSRLVVAWTFASPASQHAATVLALMQRVLTDNGPEFHKVFDQACITHGIPHFWTVPRSPKMNAHVERFNRTLQEEALLPHTSADLVTWNQALTSCLIRYNAVRPHFSLHDCTPLEYFVSASSATPDVSRMLWTSTSTCIMTLFMLL